MSKERLIKLLTPFIEMAIVQHVLFGNPENHAAVQSSETPEKNTRIKSEIKKEKPFTKQKTALSHSSRRSMLRTHDTGKKNRS